MNHHSQLEAYRLITKRLISKEILKKMYRFQKIIVSCFTRKMAKGVIPDNQLIALHIGRDKLKIASLDC